MICVKEIENAIQEVRELRENPDMGIRAERMSRLGLIGWSLMANGKPVPEELEVKELSKLKPSVKYVSDFELADFTFEIQNWITAEYFVMTSVREEGIAEVLRLKNIVDNAKTVLEYKNYIKELNKKVKMDTSLMLKEPDLKELKSLWNFEEIDIKRLENGFKVIKGTLFNLKWYNTCIEMASETLNAESLKLFKITYEEITNLITTMNEDKLHIVKLIKEFSKNDPLGKKRIEFSGTFYNGLAIKDPSIGKPTLEKTKRLMLERKFSDRYFMKIVKK